MNIKRLMSGILFMGILLTTNAYAQVVVSAVNTVYTEDFNTLSNSGTTQTILPAGAWINEAGTSGNTSYRAGDGSSNTGDTYSFGTGTNSDRSLGSVASASVQSNFGMRYLNNTGTTITSITITYTMEQWRSGGRTGLDSMYFYYGLNNAGAITGSWTRYAAGDVVSKVTQATAAALDGNLAANNQSYTLTISGLTVNANDTLYLRWQDPNVAGNDDGLSIDDISFTASGSSSGVPAPPAILSLASSAITKTTATISWTKPAGYVDSTMTTLVFLKQGSAPTSGTPTLNPAGYTGNSNFSLASSTFQNDIAAKCIYNADGNTISVSGLTLGTTYHAMVYVVRNADSAYSAAVRANYSTLGVPAAVTNLGFAATGQTTGTVSWTKATGYVDSTMTTLVFVKAATSITAGTPTSASSVYTADTNFAGSGSSYQNDATAKCVYNGDGTTITLSNLSLNTTYYLLVYTVRNSDTTYSTGTTANGTTFGTIVPPPALTSIGLGNVGSTFSTIQWKKGNYVDSTMSIVVYMKRGTSITQGSMRTAVNNINANATFGLGSILSSDSLAYCIYKGDTSAVNVTGLTPSTSYALIAYVIRDADTAYSTPVTTTFSTLAPPAAPVSLSIGTRTQTTLSLSFTRPSGVDTLTHSFVLFMKRNVAVVQGNPSLGVSNYAASTVWGNGSKYQNDTSAFCILNGALNTVTVSGLTPGTTYHVLGYTVRKADSVYSSPVTTSGVTVFPNPNPLSSVLLNGTSQTSATVSWNKSVDYINATHTVLVFAKKGSPIVGAAGGNITRYTASATFGSGTKLSSDSNAFCIFKGDTTFVNVSNLTGNSQYFVSAYAVRDADSAYSAVANGSGTTLGVPPYYAIGSINKVNTTTGVPDSLNVRVTVRGIVYGANQRATGLQFVLRDVTGGTTVFITNKNFGYTVTEGDSIEVQGIVTTFRGLHEIGSLDTIIVLGSGKTLKQPTTVSTLNEASENDLVKLNAVKFVTVPTGGTWPAASSNISVLTPTNDTVVVRILSTFAIAGKPLPSTPTFNIVGLGAQFSTSAAAPYAFNGYQLFPRTQSDISEIPVVADSLTPFNLLSPADNDTILLNNTNLNDTVLLGWTPSINSNGIDTVVYTFMLDTVTGDFSTPRFELNTGKANLLPLTKNNVYLMATSSGLGSGEVFSGIWKVRANSQQLVRFSDDFRHLFIRNEVTTGTAEVNRLQQVTLFPNPAHDRLTLQGLTPHKDVVTVMNITGKRELSMVADETTFSVSLNGLAPGMYLIKIQSGDASIIKKIILQ